MSGFFVFGKLKKLHRISSSPINILVPSLELQNKKRSTIFDTPASFLTYILQFQAIKFVIAFTWGAAAVGIVADKIKIITLHDYIADSP